MEAHECWICGKVCSTERGLSLHRNGHERQEKKSVREMFVALKEAAGALENANTFDVRSHRLARTLRKIIAKIPVKSWIAR
jgi:hypothetical protein